jgi:cobalt-zinc-cadmium efflux system membrane fusion protein
MVSWLRMPTSLLPARSAFGWIAAGDDLAIDIPPTASGTVSQVFASVAKSVAQDAPLVTIRTEAGKANPTDAASASQEIVVAAPGAGVVTQFGVAVGQVVKTTNPGSATKAASIADLSSVWLIAEIDENNARPLRSDQPVEVRPTALAGRVYKGTLSTVSPIDPGTKRATARIVVENTDGALKLGMLAQFNLSTRRLRNAGGS